MIIDLDAHQGNGHESVLANDKRVTIFDMYNANAYPRDYNAKQQITFDVPVQSGISDADYLRRLKTELPKALNRLKTTGRQPDLIIYNAGSDIVTGDPVGNMNVSDNGVVRYPRVRAIVAVDAAATVCAVPDDGVVRYRRPGVVVAVDPAALRCAVPSDGVVRYCHRQLFRAVDRTAAVLPVQLRSAAIADSEAPEF